MAAFVLAVPSSSGGGAVELKVRAVRAACCIPCEIARRRTLAALPTTQGAVSVMGLIRQASDSIALPMITAPEFEPLVPLKVEAGIMSQALSAISTSSAVTGHGMSSTTASPSNAFEFVQQQLAVPQVQVQQQHQVQQHQQMQFQGQQANGLQSQMLQQVHNEQQQQQQQQQQALKQEQQLMPSTSVAPQPSGSPSPQVPPQFTIGTNKVRAPQQSTVCPLHCRMPPSWRQRAAAPAAARQSC